MARETYVKLETITPERAAKLLEMNKRNRPMKPVNVDRLAAAMRRNDFKLNGETIKLNGQELVDGQNRLQACIDSGKSFETFVAYGVPSGAFDTIDTGTPRSTADTFCRSGEQYYTQLGGAVRQGMAFEKGQWRWHGKLDNQLAHRWLKANAGIRDSIYPCFHTYASRIAAPGTLIAVHYLFCKAGWDRAVLDEFMLKLGSGEGLDITNPIFHLRRRLLDAKMGGIKAPKLGQEATAAYVIRAATAFVLGEKMVRLQLPKGEMPAVQIIKPKGK